MILLITFLNKSKRSSTESNVNLHINKVYAAIDRFVLFDKIKKKFFQAVAVLITTVWLHHLE